MKTRFIYLTLFLTACSASQPPDTCNAAPVCSEVRPDTAKSKLHFREHVSYPADRTQILAACAKTKEFSDAERKWFILNLPEGEYSTADEVITALRL